jgi:hypothetical protein
MSPEPTHSERKLIDAAREGRAADYTSADPEKRTLRAEVIYALATGMSPGWAVSARGIWVIGAKIIGQLDFGGAHVRYRLALVRCYVEEPLLLVDASTRSISLAGSHLIGIQAERLTVTGSLFLNEGFTAKGEVNLNGATITGQLNCRKGCFEGSKTALNADGSTVSGGVFLDQGFSAKGDIRLLRAQIKGELNCHGGHFEKRAEAAFVADGATVTGGVFFGHGFTAKGEVRLLRAQVTGELNCTGGIFENPNGPVLCADGARLVGNLILGEGFIAQGAVMMSGVDIEGDLSCSGASFHALLLERSMIGRTLFLKGLKKKARIDLMHARARQLSDDRKSWPDPGSLLLDGFEYGAIAPDSVADATSRIEWLNLTPKDNFSTRSFEQLARVLRTRGDEPGARKVSVEGQRALRKWGNLPKMARFANWFLDWSVCYGYQTWRVLVGALVIVLFGTFMFWNWFWNLQTWPVPMPPVVTSGRLQPIHPKLRAENQANKRQLAQACFLAATDHLLFSFFYSLDVFLPFGDLHQKSTHMFQPRHSEDWWFYLNELWYVMEMMSGWVVAGLIAAAVTGLTRR